MAPTRFVLLGGALVLVGFMGAPAHSQDKPGLKELLGRVQSESESKAVEDLIGKLKGGRDPASSNAPAPATKPAQPPPPSPAATPATQPKQEPERPAAANATPPKAVPPPVSPVSPPASAAPPAPAPTMSPDEAVKRADAKEAPSIDLEILFGYKSAEITQQSAAALTALGRALSAPQLAGDSFLIAGHTDAKGGAAYNLTLSQQRAEAVRQFLISNFKIDGSRLVAKGYGLERLKNALNPLDGVNRRVQIVNLSMTPR
jgi:outer membrane protein OmpA-like peptidoglycan-associated protein